MLKDKKIDKARDELAKIQEQRAGLSDQAAQKAAALTQKKSSLGSEILEGGDLAKLSSQIAGEEQEAAALEQALALAAEQERLFEQALSDAIQKATEERIALLSDQAAKIARDTLGPLAELERAADEIKALHSEANNLAGDMPAKSRPEGRVIKGQVPAIKTPATMIAQFAPKYRFFVEKHRAEV